jgi:hypothetical protein
MTKDELIGKIKEVFGDAIKVHLAPDIVYMNTTKVTFVCEEHGEFTRTATDIFRRNGCQKCNRSSGRKLIQDKILETFKIEAPKKFNNKFTYDYSTFKGHRKPMRMICPEHGEFWAEPSRHLHKHEGGCPVCGELLRYERKSIPDTDWIAKAKNVHENKYEYISISPILSKSLEKNRIITFICPAHGTISNDLKDHVLNGKGCIECGYIASSEKRVRTYEEVQQEIEGMFPGRLSFDKFTYESSRKPFELICKKHKITFEVNMGRLHSNPSFYPCPKCSPRSDSAVQRLIANILKREGLDVIYNDKKTLGGKEIDIYVPKLNLGIEYNGVYWHSEKWQSKDRYHLLTKQILAKSKGIDIVNFDSTVPINKIINFVRFKSGNIKKVFARKTVVEAIDSLTAESFLDELHIQGAAKKCKSYGLFYEEKLIGVASFSRANSERGNTDLNRWELRRMAFSCRVVGGASKLLKAFIVNTPNVESIISYSDNRWFNGGVYEALGFSYVKDCNADYCYTKNDSIYHKAQFQHSAMKTKKNFIYDETLTEVQNCHNNGYYRIWDCGKKKWELTIKGTL